MALADWLDRIGGNFQQRWDAAGPQGLAQIGAAIASAPRGQGLAGLAQGLAGFGAMADKKIKQKGLADALSGAMDGLSPQQQAFLKAVDPEQAAEIVGGQLFKDKQASGPFAGTGFEASVGNILARGAMDPAFRNTPEYKLAEADWTKPQFVMGPNGPQIFQRSLPKPGAPAQPMPQPVAQPSPQPAVPPPARPGGGLTPPPANLKPDSPGQFFNPDMHPELYDPVASKVESTAPSVTVLPGGATVTDLGVGAKPTESQQKAGDYFVRMKGAEQIVGDGKAQSLYMDWSNGLAREGGVGFMQGDVAQKYETAGDEWIAALLRKDSGAQVPPPELASLRKIYIPQWGDKPARIAYKKAARDRAAAAIASGLTPEQVVKAEKIIADNPSPQTDYPAPPPEAVARLKMTRDKENFDEVFGPGAADRILGGK